jgi:hypothetical protein
LITIELEEYYPDGERKIIDIHPCLFQGLILSEKEFREWIKTENWEKYEGKLVAVYCSTDAIIPNWAYMLLAARLQPFARKIVFGSAEQLETVLFEEVLTKIDPKEFENARVVIKGCSNKPVPVNAYVHLVNILRPVAKSIMYGEPCSTVPIYKAKS